jgi:hypothetical protein
MRLVKVRGLVEDMLLNTARKPNKNKTGHTLDGVARCACRLAWDRDLDPEIAEVAGLLHDYYGHQTGVANYPGPNSADTVRPILRGTQCFTDEELTFILRAIFYQEDRHRIQGPYEELMKEAIALYAEEVQSGESDVAATPSGNGIDQEDRRLRLADYAERLAGQNIIGLSEDERYRAICQYWPDTDIYKVLEKNWCAAFVYYCCMQTGISLPIRYPNHKYRLAGVGAWLEWAQLPETGFFYQDDVDGFQPQRGDLVVYDKLLSAYSHDHIGIVLVCEADTLWVAEGNQDNANVSGVLSRPRGHCIHGYIRIDNGYRYQFNGEYRPIT